MCDANHGVSHRTSVIQRSSYRPAAVAERVLSIMESTLLFLGVLFAGMAIGMSIALSLLLSAVALMWQLDFFNTQLLSQNLQAGFDNFPLLEIGRASCRERACEYV